MARVVAIVDSDTGRLVDAVGNGREGARYKKFAKRMISLDSPVAELDYGANGATSLKVSRNGAAGSSIDLKADEVNVSNDSGTSVLKVNGSTLDEIISGSGDSALGKVVGTEGEIEAKTETEMIGGVEKDVRRISLSQEIKDALETAGAVAEEFYAGTYVDKEGLKDAIYGISFDQSLELEDVIRRLSTLMNRLNQLANSSN